MKSVENKIIKEIDNLKIKPFPKSRFIIKNILFFILFLIFFCVGALSIAVMLCVTTDSAEFYEMKNYSLFVLLNIIPYFWLMLSLVFLVIAYINSNKMENGYKYLTVKNIIITILVCILSGIVLHKLGIASIIENSISSKSYIYNNYIYNRKKILHHPENGMLSGKILNFTITLDKQEINLEDIDGKLWKILITSDTIFKSKINIKNGIYINVSGEDNENNVFIAKIIKEIPVCCIKDLIK